MVPEVTQASPAGPGLCTLTSSQSPAVAFLQVFLKFPHFAFYYFAANKSLLGGTSPVSGAVMSLESPWLFANSILEYLNWDAPMAVL